MKFLRKILPYGMRRVAPMVGIAGGAALIGACRQEPDVMPLIPAHHQTVYTFGPFNNAATWSVANICASADSASVDSVILQSDGVSWFSYASAADVIQWRLAPVINAVNPKNRQKLRGRGELKDVLTADSASVAWLKEFGFTFSR